MSSFFKQKDKQLHMLGSAILTIVAYLLVKSLSYAVIGTLAIGIVKEIYDYFHPKKHTADIKDIFADMIGITIASLVIWLF